MKSGEIWIDIKGELRIKLICKLSGITPEEKDGFWKCENLTPQIGCTFSAPIEGKFSPNGIYTQNALPESIIRDYFIKEQK